ncbi:hypothetical protein QUF90_11705 [Desulfococcaceae bacterium HSG9]|nr:hypothetical protein [Desulfococcaceae bacterium HSG9]
MTWKVKFCLLFFLALPSFTGYPVNQFSHAIIPGISASLVGYFMIVNLAIPIIMGAQLYALILAGTALISIPIIFGGAGISYFIFLTGLGYASGPSIYSAHYVSLGINMLTVIPLSLSIVAVLPLQTLEYNLLQNQHGVSGAEKIVLMFLRVFNHIVYFVIPNILEVVSEERQRYKPAQARHAIFSKTCFRIQKLKLRALLQTMIQLGVEGICASIQYIPLWAVEIAQLPNRRSDKD